jgi:hypothetical protein
MHEAYQRDCWHSFQSDDQPMLPASQRRTERTEKRLEPTVDVGEEFRTTIRCL